MIMLDIYNEPVDRLKGVGQAKKNVLAKLNVKTIADIIFYFPRDYEDRTKLKKISELVINETATVRGFVVAEETIRPRAKFNIFKLTISDGINHIIINWFNQAGYMQGKFFKGQKIIITGKVRYSFGRLEIDALDYEVSNSKDDLSFGIVPVYSLTNGITQKFMRFLIKQALDGFLIYVEEILPEELLQKENMPDINWCIKNMHIPENFETQKTARGSLAYREFFYFQYAVLLNKKKIKSRDGIVFNKFDSVSELISILPFKLTKGQNIVWQEIKNDLCSNKPMMRLLQGDVGSGKTVIAEMSLVACCGSGYQGVLMAPTEILAKQHYLDLLKRMNSLALRVGLLTGSMPVGEKNKILLEIKNGQIDLLIGTHAIIQENVKFKSLGLIVIDEQHRFGVNQRMKLQKKAPDANVLVMSATPIPRTLALTFYGNLDISTITDKPKARGNIFTRYVFEKDRKKLYEFIKKHLNIGRQAFVVCPLIEESENFKVEAAVKMEKQLKEEFVEYTVRLVHGRLPVEDREKIMADFKLGNLQILIGTTVVEVGINVPNANIMVVEGIERFGLSQLHQLRGRVARSSYDAYCFLLGDLSSENVKYRAKAMCETNDGFKIAEMDLELRGPGEFHGTKQHGALEFKVADLARDYTILVKAKKDVEKMINSISFDKQQKVIKANKFFDKDLMKIMF